jgi:hypothetical protein
MWDLTVTYPTGYRKVYPWRTKKIATERGRSFKKLGAITNIERADG